MPEPTGQTVDTPFGVVDLDATPEGGEQTQQTEMDSEGQPPVAEPAAQPIRIGDAEYTLDELQEKLTKLENVHEMYKTADERYKAAKALEDDPNLTEMRETWEIIQRNPALRENWELLQAWRQGQQIGPVPNLVPYVQRMESLEAKIEATEFKGHLESARTDLDALIKEHNAIPGEAKWSRDSAEFKAFFGKFNEDVPPNAPNAGDVRSYFWATYGPKMLERSTAAARAEGGQAVVETIKKGREAGLTEVAPAPHKSVPWEPDMTVPGLDDCIEKAIADDSLFKHIGR
jgi:hypothetical protein